MKKKKAILIIAIIVAALLVIFLLVVPAVNNAAGQINDNQSEMEKIPEALQEGEQGQEEVQTEVDGEGIMVDPDLPAIEVGGGEVSQILDAPDDYLGQMVKVTGTVYDPVDNSGMLNFGVAVADGKAQVNVMILNEEEEYQLKNGDDVTVTGVIYAIGEAEGQGGEIEEMPLINATELEIG